MDRDAMMTLFQQHRDAEARRDFDAIVDTFTTDCYLETIALGLRSDGREAVRSSYEAYFTAFPDLAPEDNGFAAGDDVLVSWGVLRGTSRGDWLGVPPSGTSFAVRFTNVSTFKDERMRGETLYFDLATLCEQAEIPIDAVRAAARARAASA